MSHPIEKACSTDEMRALPAARGPFLFRGADWLSIILPVRTDHEGRKAPRFPAAPAKESP